MKKVFFLLLVCSCLPVRNAEGNDSGFWNIPAMRKAPQVAWGKRTGLTREIRYSNVPHEGTLAQVFAYLAVPEAGPGPFPAMVLVHGGAGKAYKEWAELWAGKGYIAIAMDLTGRDSSGVRLRQPGPEMNHQNIFQAANEDMRNGWIYHAVAAVVKARSILADMPEVDQERVGITGISWGGFVTCLVAGMDHRYHVAVPVYGCGFIYQDGFWKDTFRQMMPAQRERWASLFDPSNHLPAAKCPILFVNGNSDTHFPLENTSRSAFLVDEELRHVSFIDGLRHGHNWSIPEVDAFIDAVLLRRKLPVSFSPPAISRDEITARMKGLHDAKENNAFLYHAPKTTFWKERKWEKSPATVHDGEIRAKFPRGGVFIFYFSVKDSSGMEATSICGMTDG